MNKKLLKVFGSLSLLAMIVAGCDTSVNESSSNNSSSVVDDSSSSDSSSSDTSSPDTSTPDSSTPDSSSSEEVETYVVVVLDTGMSTVEVSTGNEKVAPGTIVDVTVKPIDGYKVEKVTLNGRAITSSEGNVYSFEMPRTSARIQVTTSLVNKDGIIVDGDISVRLTDEDGDGIYVARNIPVQQDSDIYYSVSAGSDPLGMIYIDNEKTFANISVGKTKDGFGIGGNAIYDFYYDSNDSSTPIYIQRVGVINLPSTDASFYALFAGEAKSDSTVYPAGVNSVSFTSTRRNESYQWNLYSDNSSYAQVKSLMTNKEKAIVYKAQVSDKVYKVVDSYTEGSVDPNYVTKSDLTAFSGQYDIVDTVTNKKYQRLQSEVDVDANLYSHTMESLDARFYQAYRNGYTGNIYNDSTVEHDSSVVSTARENGDFEVNLNSWVRWENSSYYQSYLGLFNAYITFEMNVVFTAAGAIRSGEYIETVYTDTTYDFNSNQFKAGYETVEPKEYATFAYGYGDPIQGQPNVDVSKYFTQNITNVKVQSKTITDKQNTLPIGEQIYASVESQATSSSNMTFVCEPLTALDQWQYGTVSSSDLSVIAPRGISYPYEFKAVGFGEADVTIGNHTQHSNSVTYTQKISVEKAAYIKSIWMYPLSYINPSDAYDYFGANTANIEASKVYKVQMAGTSSSGSHELKGLELTFEFKSNEGLLDLYYDNNTGILTIDATKAASITEKTTVSVSITCPYQLSDWPQSSLTFNISPKVDLDVLESLANTSWSTTSEECSGTTINFTSSTAGVINYTGGLGTKTINFTYSYDNATGDVTVSIPTVNGEYFTCYMYVDPDDMSLCVALLGEKIGTSWDDITYNDYIGYVVEDDPYESYYTPFTQAN